MLQRHRRPTLEEFAAVARQELEEDFNLFFQPGNFRKSLMETADKILTMFSNVSSPLIATQIIKQKMTANKHPHALHMEVILDKAELFYLQSVTHDLKKLKEQERIMQISSEDIKEYIQQINGKMGYDRESILNQSQEICENIDLMKFFEGVRNYQNVFETNQKHCIEKLRKIAVRVENEATLKRGYLAGKLAIIHQNFIRSTKEDFFKISKSNYQLKKKLDSFVKLERRILQEAFKNILIKSKQKNQTMILKQLFNNLGYKTGKRSVLKQLRSLNIKSRKLAMMSQILSSLVSLYKMKAYHNFFKKANTAPFKKASNFGEAIRKIDHFTRQKSFKKILGALGLTSKSLCLSMHNFYKKNMIFAINSIYETLRQKQAKNKAISNHMKGKILASLNHFEQKPPNLKKTFLSWYLKSREEEYSQKIYNIWLKGNVSKFVFFMRIKNCINQSKKYKIKHELKVFLLIFMQNMNKYYEHNEKSFLAKWHTNTKRKKHFESLCLKLGHAGSTIDHNMEYNGFELIKDTASIKKKLSKYYSLMSQNTYSNIKTSFDKWKIIPNLRKAQGRINLLKYLRDKIAISNEGQFQVFQKFKEEQIVGYEKKINFLRKVFSKDILYMANYFSRWRQNNRSQNFKNILEHQEKMKVKEVALMKLISRVKKNDHLLTLSAIQKFNAQKQYNHHRRIYAKKILGKLITRFSKENMIETFHSFQEEFQVGRMKKDKLVENLVQANKLKQAQVLYTLNAFAQTELKNERRERVKNVILALTGDLKTNIVNSLFQKSLLPKVLRQILINKYSRTQIGWNLIKNLPPRVQWNKRQNCITLYKKLEFMLNKRANTTYNSFKSCHYAGQFKKKRMLDVMTFRYVDASKNYFKIYNRNIREIIFNEKSKILTANFDSLNEVVHQNFASLLEGEQIWRKKEQYLKKLNKKLRDRLQFAIKTWHTNSKSLSYFIKIKDEKKKRLLTLFSECLNKNQFMESKKCINMFHKNSKIIQLQTNFLRRLCDTQAGKASKAFMIWKNLPEQKNKELMKRGSRFQSNLLKFGDKILRSVFGQFKDIHYVGNERKKVAIKKLVAKNCAGIENYFSLWRQKNKMIILYKKTNIMTSLAEVMLRIEQQNFSSLIQGNKSEKVNRIFTIVSKWWLYKQGQYFKKWRQQIHNLQDFDEDKKRKLTDLARIEKQNKRRKAVQIIQQMKTRAFLKKIFIQYFLQNKAAKVQDGFKALKGLPDWKRKVKKQEKVARIRMLADMTNFLKRKQMNQVFLVFRDNKYTGNFKKYKSMELYLKDKIHEVHIILKDWNNMSQNKKKQERYEKVSHLFGYSYEIVRSNFSPIISNIREMQIKKKAIQRLLNAQRTQASSYLKLWSTRVRELKIHDEFQNHQKKIILDKINGLLTRKDGKLAKQIVQKFHLNMKITGIQTKFLQRLLQTKSGKTMHAFNVWKSIPSQNMMAKYRKGQKFFYKLEHLIKNKISEVNSTFKEQYDEGNSIKKQSVLQLLDLTSTGIRRYYNRWDKLTKRELTLKQANSIMHALDTMNERLAENFMIIFQDERTNKIKTWAIEKIIKSFGLNKGMYFQIWKQNIREWKLRQSMNNQKKQVALQAFSKVLGKSKYQDTIDIIDKFKKNLHITKISKNFLNKLLRTKSGKVMQLFELWKSIPDIKFAQKKKRAIKFESNLNKMVHKFLKKGYEPFKTESYDGRNKKKKCIQRLILASMGEEKKKFYIWRQIVKQEKILTHTQLFDNLFHIMSNHVSTSIHHLVKDSKNQIVKKQSLCRKLINNSNFVQHHAYFIWKEALQADNIKIEKQEAKAKVYLNNLINVEKKVTNKKLVQLINKFRIIKDQKNSQNAEIAKNSTNKKIIAFYNKLESYARKKNAVFIESVKRQSEEYNFLQKTSEVDKTFRALDSVFTENFRIIMRSNRETIIIQKCINKLLVSCSSSLQRMFNIWRQNKNILRLQQKMDGQKKKNILNIINKMLQKQQKSQVPYAIGKFEKNYKQTKLQKQILVKILNSKAGKVPLAFMKWKSIPNQGAKKMKQKAMKFQAGLARVFFSRMKKTYEKFKDGQYEGTSKKRLAINKLFMATMSDSNRYFNKWRKSSHQLKITDKMLALNRGFEVSLEVFRQNFVILDRETIYEQQTKLRSVTKLFNNTEINYKLAFKIWRDAISQNKLDVLNRVFTKYGQKYFENKHLALGFLMIRKQADVQVVRAYINSLWKWKMSNFQANYYAKFIKVFKESEQLLSLSTTLNKRKYENMHSAFRAILMVGKDRRNRKQRITQKYLTRKIQNYFNRFKINAFMTEIQLWKENYTQSVKARKLSELLERILRKQQKDVLDSLAGNQLMIQNLGKASVKINSVATALKQNAFNSIYYASYDRFIQRIDIWVQNLALKLKGEAFLQLVYFDKTTLLVEKAGKVSNRYVQRVGYQKILSKSMMKISRKLALRFLLKIQDQKILMGKEKAIESFKKLAQKAHSLRNISMLVAYKEQENYKEFYNILRKVKNREALLSSFRKGMVIKKILDCQDNKLLKIYFERMKKKQNAWAKKSFERFLLRCNIKSSMAVSMYRFKNSVKNQ